MARLFDQIAIAITISFLTVASSLAAIPGADNPKALTHSGVLEKLADCSQRTLVGAYEAVGHHDAKWDAAAKTLLDAEARYFTQSQATSKYPSAHPATAVELANAAHKVTASGCDDPLVLMAVAFAMQESGRVDDLKPLTQRAVDALIPSKYPTERRAQAVRWSMWHLEAKEDAARRDALKAALFQLDLDSSRRTDWPDLDRRFVYFDIANDLNGWPIEDQKHFLEVLKSQPADEWLGAMLAGDIHLHIGWHARGTGYANTVTDEGFKTLAAELALAEQEYGTAERCRPDFPEAATDLIGVSMGQSKDVASIRDCFDRQ